MGKYCMPEVVKMLGVEIGEDFDLLDGDGEIVVYSPYKFTGDSIIDCEGDALGGWRLWDILTGEYTIQKRPWRPKDDSKYYTVSLDGRVTWCHFYKDEEASLALLNMGNCFQSKEAAKAAVPEMLEKFEEIKKGVRE